MFKQPQADKDKVVAALRSGNYQQGREVLKRVTKEGKVFYCCLGVMQEVISGEVETDGPGSTTPSFRQYSSLPSKDWCIEFGISIESLPFPLVPKRFLREEFDNYKGEPVPLADLTAAVLNDELQLTFSQIADLWEYFVEGY